MSKQMNAREYWIVYDPEDGITGHFDNEAEALNELENVRAQYYDEDSVEWYDDVQYVFVARITHRIKSNGDFEKLGGAE